MKRHIIPCILSLTLLLTACGGEQAAADTAEEAVKDHYYQILDAAGKELYTVTDSGAVAEIDALINKAGRRERRPQECGGRPSLHLCLLAGDYPPRWGGPGCGAGIPGGLPDPGAAGQQRRHHGGPVRYPGGRWELCRRGRTGRSADVYR